MNNQIRTTVTIDEEYYQKLVANQKTPEDARYFIGGVARYLRAMNKTLSTTTIAKFLEDQLDKAQFPSSSARGLDTTSLSDQG